MYQSFIVDAVPRSVDYSKFLLVGLRNGSILEFDITNNAKESIMVAHHDGETWGLCMLDGTTKFVTSGEDNKILMYDFKSRKVVQRGDVVLPDEEHKEQQKPKVVKGGASTTSKEPPEKQSRALAYQPEMNHLAVADNTGCVTVREVSFEKGATLNKVIKKLSDSQEWIECMAYSPQGAMLAVGSHDNNIYVYAVERDYVKYCTLRGHTSFVTGLDWSLSDSPAYIRSNCGGYELLFFDVDAKIQDKHGPSNTAGVDWATQTTKLGWNVEFIYPEGCDGTHINSVDMCHDLNLIACGDDYGLVNIYRNPVRSREHQARSFRAHSEHVTAVRFSSEGDHIVSVGGMDRTVIQWRKFVPKNL